MTVRGYRVEVEPLAGHLGGGYVAYAPVLKGCVSDGETREEALRNVGDAIDCWLAAARDLGLPIPEPVLENNPPVMC